MDKESIRPLSHTTGVDIPETPDLRLLNTLLADRGLGWDTLARVTGVGLAHLRRWRGGQTPPGDAVERLVEFGNFLDTLDNWAGYTDPIQAAQHIESLLSLPPGYLIHPIDLYLEGHRKAVLELATCTDQRAIETVLDQVRPRWRENRSNYEVFLDTDGNYSIRPRSDA